MEPISTAVSISPILMNLAAFLEERRGRKEAQEQATIQEYTEWLRRREHTEAIAMLESNQKLTLAIEHLLSNGHDKLLERFDQLEAMLALILGATAEWGELVKSIDPTAGLSDQAISIIRWFDGTGGSKAIGFPPGRGDEGLMTMNGHGKRFKPMDSDARFFEDDMMILVNLGLLTPSFGSRGSPKYTITREAIELVKSLVHKKENNG